MDIERSVNSLLESLLPAREERPPILLTVFDSVGKRLYRRRLDDATAAGSAGVRSVDPSSAPDSVPELEAEARSLRAADVALPDEAEEDGETWGATRDGCPWIRIVSPLPDKRRG